VGVCVGWGVRINEGARVTLPLGEVVGTDKIDPQGVKRALLVCLRHMFLFDPSFLFFFF